MITTILNGGLGNQLFQIAVAYALAEDNNDECAFNFDRTVVHQGNSPLKYENNLYSKLNKLPLNWTPSTIYAEPRFNYERIPYKDELKLIGYFQSEKYFSRYKVELTSLFLNDVVVREVIDKLWREYYIYLCGNSVSLHIRRGDYVNFKDIHTNLSPTYYSDALRLIDNIDYVLVFSDDIPWCKENITGRSFIYVEGLQDYEDLCLMSLCKNNIIANSSFSWWAAYMNNNPHKMVVAPFHWFGHAFKDEWEDIYTNEMIVI